MNHLTITNEEHTKLIETKTQAKLALEGLKPPIRTALVKASYRTNKAIFNGYDRILGFWEAILTNAPICKGVVSHD